jgi:hypothetical protein
MHAVVPRLKPAQPHCKPFHTSESNVLLTTPFLTVEKSIANSVASVRERRLSANLVPTIPDRVRRVVRGKDPSGHILGFLDRTRYYFFQVAVRLYSRGWVDPVPDPLLLRKSGSAGNRNRTRTSGSVGRNHYSTEAVIISKQYLKIQMVLHCKHTTSLPHLSLR